MPQNVSCKPFIKSFEARKRRVFLVNFYFDTTFPTSLSKTSTMLHKISWDQYYGTYIMPDFVIFRGLLEDF